MPLKIHLFLPSHRMFALTKLYHAEETHAREARKEFFFAATFIARIFVVAGKLAEIYCLDLGGERDEEHDKELTERLECQENLLRTFLGKRGMRRCKASKYSVFESFEDNAAQE